VHDRAATGTAAGAQAFLGITEGFMPHARYFIVRQADDWVIKFEDEEFGPYNSQAEAMLFAIDAAQKLGEQGDSAEVCLMGENGHFRPEWTYGRDPYPPRL
jgi:Uncharacterized protein conserved in bacteria (DUF2188)